MALFLSLLLSFAAVRGFRFKITADYIKPVDLYSFGWVLLFITLVWALHRVITQKNIRLSAHAALFALIISTFSVFGASIAKMRRISWIWENRNYLLNFLNLYFAHFILYFCAAYLAFQWLESHPAWEQYQKNARFSFRKALLWWGILFLCYLPWYLYLYPGMLSPDSGTQISDAITTGTLNDHHSAFLDLVLRAILIPVRNMTGSLQIGVGICTLLQMMVLTFAFASCYEWMRQYVRNKLLRVTAFLWFAFLPVHNLYSVTLWKDILFSVCFLFLLLTLDAAARDEEAFFRSRKKQAALFLTLLLLPLMRHNGLSVTLVTAIYLFFRFKTHRRQTALIGISALAVFGLWDLAILPALNASKVTPAHIYSVQEQQIVRVLDEKRGELSEEERAELGSYFKLPDIWMVYNPILSDPVKNQFNNEKFSEAPGKFLSLWLSLGLRYPVVYLEALLMNNYGFWTPEINYWYSDFYMAESAQIEDIHPAPVWKPGIIEKVYNWFRHYEFLKTPLVLHLFNAGSCFWMWIFCGVWCLYQNRKKFLLFVPGFALWLGLLVAPLANDFRYAYGLFAGLPLLLAVTLTNRNPSQNS